MPSRDAPWRSSAGTRRRRRIGGGAGVIRGASLACSRESVTKAQGRHPRVPPPDLQQEGVRHAAGPVPAAAAGSSGRVRPAVDCDRARGLEYAVHGADECLAVLAVGAKGRATRGTQMNASSSRSHLVFTSAGAGGLRW